MKQMNLVSTVPFNESSHSTKTVQLNFSHLIWAFSTHYVFTLPYVFSTVVARANTVNTQEYDWQLHIQTTGYFTHKL